MNKEQVLAINGLTQAQKEAAERWFKTPFNRGKEIEGNATQVKQFLNEKIAAHEKMQAAKAKREEENGTLEKVTALVKSLCQGTRQAKAMFTYNDIYNIIQDSTNEKVEQANQVKQQFAELQAKAAELGIKL